MPGRILGFDIDAYAMKIAVCDRKKRLVDFFVTDLPDNMLREGRYTSPEAMGDFIKETLKAHHIRGGQAVVSLSDRSYFLKRVKLPRMTTDQLTINLPYEFHDYITGESTNYVYDYAVLSMGDKEMELMAATTAKETIEVYTRIMKRAGLKLVKLVPGVLGIQSILLPQLSEKEQKKQAQQKAALEKREAAQAARAAKKAEKAKKGRKGEPADGTGAEEAAAPGGEGTAPAGQAAQGAAGEQAKPAGQAPEAKEPAAPRPQDYAVLDITHDGTQFHFFSNGSFEITRDMNTGMKDVIQTIAQNHGVEAHIADLMMKNNQDHVLEEADVSNILDTMTTEVMRVINFYNYNNARNNIDRILYCGGGIPWDHILPRIEEATGMPVQPLAQLIPGAEDKEEMNLSPQAYGVIIE